MLSALAMPASMIITGFTGVGLFPWSPSSISANVAGSLALPGNTWLLSGKPLPSRTRPKVTKGQSLRFSLERPNWALGFCAHWPSK